MFHVGVLGHSLEGALAFMRALRSEGEARLGPHQHPEVTMTCLPLGTSVDAWQRARVEEIRFSLSLGLGRLRDAAADFFVCPDVTAHLALDSPGSPLALPGLHVGEVLAEAAHRRGFARVGILGTKWTMGSDLFCTALDPLGITAVVPHLSDQASLHAIILDDLVRGRFPARSRDTCVEIIERLAALGCEAVVLASNELPSLVTAGSSPLPVLDPNKLLAEASMRTALSEVPLPTWRGGSLDVPLGVCG